MVEVVGVVFNNSNKVYYFSPKKLKLRSGITVIVETEYGTQFGKVVEGNKEIPSSRLNSELRNVIRIATKNDYQKNLKNISDAKKTLVKCKELVEKYGLNMQVIDATYNFDRSQLVFKFISDNRIDFRNLVKELASIYKTRIELRQVGARDRAKEIGGCGACGQKLCCSRFLKDLDAVSINMAKNQNLSLNPSKINGACGRLLCCLRYEDEVYTSYKFDLPTIGSKVTIPEGTGKVVAINILKKKYKVEIPDVGIVEVFKNEND